MRVKVMMLGLGRLNAMVWHSEAMLVEHKLVREAVSVLALVGLELVRVTELEIDQG